MIEAIGQVPPSRAKKAAIEALNPKMWEKFYRKIYSDVMNEFASQTLKSYKEVKSLEELDEKYLEEAEKFLDETTLLRSREVLETSQKRLTKTIAAVLLLAGGTKEIQKALADMYDHDIPIRSRALAQTEVITAGNAGASFAAQSVNAKRKEWVAVMDGRTRDNHREVDGEIQAIGTTYSNGLRFPGDPLGPAHLTINCRCVEVYLLT